MEGSENVKSNLSFSEESEQDLYDGSLFEEKEFIVFI